MYETYQYIHKPDIEHDSALVLDNKYKSVEDLGKRFVIYNGKYYVYPNMGKFLEHLGEMPDDQKVFHEVIFERPQKLKFDIDAKVSKLGPNPAAAYQEASEDILDAIRTAFLCTYGINLEEHNVIICESHGLDIFSAHIIIAGYYVSGSKQAVEFTRRVCDYLPQKHHPLVDMSVNKSIQNFRIAGCHKAGGFRVKKIVTGHKMADTLISNIADCELLPDVPVAFTPYENKTTLLQEEIDAAIAVCKSAGILEHSTYKCTRDAMLLFRRTRPGYCKICADTHTRDNSVLVYLGPKVGGYMVFEQCRRYLFYYGKDGNHFHQIGEIVSNTAVVKPQSPLRDNIPKELTQLLFHDLPNKNVYDEAVLRPFELARTLIVHAPMKIGKTKALVDYIENHFKDTLRPNVIRILSFRQTFSGNIKEKFADFVLYSDVTGPLSQSRLIVQIESLYRLDLSANCEPPDLLILDECESIFEQFDSGLLRGNFNDCFAKFQYLLKYSKHVVCMDAYVTNRTYRILQHIRQDPAMVYHRNKYQNAIDDEYFITDDKLKWLGILYATVDADETIAVPMSSLMDAKILYTNLSKKYPHKNIKLYSSEMGANEKREHFSDVNTHWACYDIIIYTPTVSAGVSFEKHHFSKLFGYFTDQSCPVETCIQMIGRVRNLADKQLFIFTQTHKANFPMVIDEIKQNALNCRGNLMKNFDEVGVHIEYGPAGEPKYYTTEYFHIWAENVLVKNISKNIFTQLFVYRVKSTGAKIQVLSDDIFETYTGEKPITNGQLNDALSQIKDDHAIAKVEIKTNATRRVVAARDISADEMEVIRANIVAQKEVSREQMAEYERFRLRRVYNYQEPLDAKFVETYNDTRVFKIFKNISKIVPHADTATALRQIQADELATHQYLNDIGDQISDINHKYTFDQHRYLLGIINILGWKSITDVVNLHPTTVLDNIRGNTQTFWEYFKGICIEFGARIPSGKVLTDVMVKNILKTLNRILKNMYGLQIKLADGVYSLDQCDLFTTSLETSKTKGIPLIV